LATAAAVVIFLPAAFFVGGDKQTAAELAQMKGQMVAIEQASRSRKNVGSNFRGRDRREPEIDYYRGRNAAPCSAMGPINGNEIADRHPGMKPTNEISGYRQTRKSPATFSARIRSI
jgi:hypothetical protein